MLVLSLLCFICVLHNLWCPLQVVKCQWFIKTELNTKASKSKYESFLYKHFVKIWMGKLFAFLQIFAKIQMYTKKFVARIPQHLLAFFSLLVETQKGPILFSVKRYLLRIFPIKKINNAIYNWGREKLILHAPSICKSNKVWN